MTPEIKSAGFVATVGLLLAGLFGHLLPRGAGKPAAPVPVVPDVVEPAETADLSAVDAHFVLDRQLFARLCLAAVEAGDSAGGFDENALNSFLSSRQASRHEEAAAVLVKDMEATVTTNPATWAELRPLLVRWATLADPTLKVAE